VSWQLVCVCDKCETRFVSARVYNGVALLDQEDLAGKFADAHCAGTGHERFWLETIERRPFSLDEVKRDPNQGRLEDDENFSRSPIRSE
jgi:hypothetical protein